MKTHPLQRIQQLGATAALLLLLVSSAAGDESRPNIIVFYTDDHGHADLSCQGVLEDIRTPNVDALARSGVRMRHGYSTAPQCVPSRGGLLVGKFQSRFGLESNIDSLDGFDHQQTIAARLRQAGYVTAQFGKWHLGPTNAIPQHGFQHVFSQNSQRPFSANITLDGQDREMSQLPPQAYHVDACSQAAAAIIRRYKDQPFFLYVAYRAPHVPLDAPRHYLDRFPGKMPERRRQALAMLSAVDDGVGLITNTLAKHGLSDQTLIFYIGDNGAPLKIHKRDAPGGGPGWDGSLNDPLNGEKGMLAEGGIHVPFVVSWPGTIPGGQTFEHPVSALDVAATAVSLAKLAVEPKELDGVNLIPHLTGQINTPPHDALMWRWISQSAIRQGKWKLLRGGDREYLYDLDADLEEQHNLASKHPEIADQLRTKLRSWAAELDPPGLSQGPMAKVWEQYFDFYLDGLPFEKAVPAQAEAKLKGWLGRNGSLTIEDNALRLSNDKPNRQRPFYVRSGFQLSGPVRATLRIKTSHAGEAHIAWRTSQQKDFAPTSKAGFQVTAGDEWQTHTVTLPEKGELIHIRIQVPAGVAMIQELRLQGSDDRLVKLW